MLLAVLTLVSGTASQDLTNDTRSAPAPSPALRTKDLRQIIKELEESDYGGYGSWGNFKIRREYRESKRNSKYAPGYSVVELEHSDPEDQLSKVATSSSSATTSLIDYYSPQNSKELVQLFERAKLIKDPMQEFSSSRVITLASFCKVSLIIGVVHVFSYMAVSPRHLSIEQYNDAYKSIVFRVASSFIWPMIVMIVLFRYRETDINQLIDVYFTSFFGSYPLLCIVEKVIATLVRIAILKYVISTSWL